MKKLLLLSLAAAALAASPAQSLAYDRNPWHEIDRMAPDLNSTYGALLAHRDRDGASPEMRDQMARLRFQLDRFNAAVRQRAGDPSFVRKAGENIGELEKELTHEFHSYQRGGDVVVHVRRRYW